MKTTITALAVAAASSAALAGNVQSQSVDIDWSTFDDADIASFDGFDDMGGTRVLTGVNFSVTGTTGVDLTALNYSPVELQPGDWSAEGFANINVFFGEFGSGYEQPLSLIEYDFTGVLGAGSGDPIFGTPGDPVATGSFSGIMLGNYSIDPSQFDTFTGSSVRTRLLGFFDGFTIGGYTIDLLVDDITATGSLTLEYQYSVVPAPASITALGVLALGATRRRR